MLRNRLIVLLMTVINLIIVGVLIAFVIQNTMIKIILMIYTLIFTSIVNFLNRPKK